MFEIELYKEWLPFCKHATNLKTVDRATKIAYLKMDLPIMSDREVYLYGCGINKFDLDGSIMIIA